MLPWTKPTPKNKLPRKEVLAFTAAFGFKFAGDKLRAPRKVMMVIKRGSGSTPIETQVWGQVLSEVGTRLSSPFPIRCLYEVNGNKIATVDALRATEFVIATCGHESETKQGANGKLCPNARRRTFGTLRPLRFKVTQVTEIEHLGSDIQEINISRKYKRSPLDDMNMWNQILSTCGNNLQSIFPVRKLYKENGEELRDVDALEKYGDEGGIVHASTTTVLPTNLKNASNFSQFIRF